MITGAEVADRLAAELAARRIRPRPRRWPPTCGTSSRSSGSRRRPRPGRGRRRRLACPRRLPEDVVAEAALALWARPEREHQYLACRWSGAGAPRRADPPTPAFLDVVGAPADRPAVVGQDIGASPATPAATWSPAPVAAPPDGARGWRATTCGSYGRRCCTEPMGPDRDAGWLFAACLSRPIPDFFVRKAIGWALREPGKVSRRGGGVRRFPRHRAERARAARR